MANLENNGVGKYRETNKQKNVRVTNAERISSEECTIFEKQIIQERGRGIERGEMFFFTFY